MAIVVQNSGNKGGMPGGLSLDGLLRNAMQQNNQMQGIAKSYAIQRNNFNNSRNLMAERDRYNRGLIDYRNQASADLDFEKTQDTLGFASSLFPEMSGVNVDDLKYLPPATAKTLINSYMTTVPSERRKKMQFKVDQVGNVDPSLRPNIQEDLNDYVDDEDEDDIGYPYNPTPIPTTPRAAVNQGQPKYTPVPESAPTQNTPGQIPASYQQNGSVIETPEQMKANARQYAIDNGNTQRAVELTDDFSNAPNTLQNSPLVRKSYITDTQEINQANRLQTSADIQKINSSDKILGFDGKPITYSDGSTIPNSMETMSKTKQYQYLQESNDLAKLSEWEQDIASATNTLQQTGQAFRQIQDYLMKDPRTAEASKEALAQVRETVNADFAEYRRLAQTDEEAAKRYSASLVDNLKRGLSRYAQFLPTNYNGANLRSAYDRLTGVLSLQLAKDLNGGRPSDPDKMGIVDALGNALNDPMTMFSKQSGMFSFIADRAGQSVLATRDPQRIKMFDDMYYAIQGAHYDPRGLLYEGGENIRTNQAQYKSPAQSPGGQASSSMTPEQRKRLDELRAKYGRK